MKIYINGNLIHETSQEDDIALDWRLIDKFEWVKNAIIGQVAHARSEMISQETNRIRGKEAGVPSSLTENDLIYWLIHQPDYKTALQREESK